MASNIETAVTVLVAISVILIIIDYVYQLSIEQKYFVYIFDIAIVGVLIADFYRRLQASGQSYGYFILKHWYEIPAMLPVVVFAVLETHTVIGAAMRGTGLIPIFRIIRLFHRTTTIFKESKVAYLIAFSSGSFIIGAFAEFIVESPHPDSKITNFGDALWWAIETVTTVGYGDLYPVTVEGKIIAAFLMIVGIGVLGIFISTFGAALIESRLRMKKSDSAVEDQSPNLEEPKSDTGTSIVHTTNFNTDAKNFIKQKVDEIEKMNEKEINMLVDMIRTIHNHQANTNNDDTNTDVRSSTR
jgi:voltage-gated potassium channel